MRKHSGGVSLVHDVKVPPGPGMSGVCTRMGFDGMTQFEGCTPGLWGGNLPTDTLISFNAGEETDLFDDLKL